MLDNLRFRENHQGKLNMADARAPEGLRPVLNLSRRRRNWPVKKLLEGLSILAAAWFLVLGSAYAPTSTTASAPPADERAQLESQLQQLESQISQYQNQIQAYQKQGKTLSGEMNKLNAQIAKLNLQVKATNLKIADLSGQIVSTEVEIGTLENSINQDEINLGSILRTLYQNESVSTLEILLKNATMTDFVNDLSSISLLQQNLHATILQIKDLKDQLSQKKDELTVAKADAETLKIARLAEKNDVSATKYEKSQLLAVTKGQESKYQAMLKDTQVQAAAIRNRLFELLGGGAMSFGQAYQFAKMAGDATGVRPAFLLAVLDRESALGKNVGQCSYHTAMNPKEQPIFNKITSALNINSETQMVSCPNADGVYGGAMGPAQFLPSTWQGYASQISQITGRPVASPWNNQDAFVAAALYLRDAGAEANERNAAARYYCGARWNRYVCTQVYGQRVVDRAAGFQGDINVLNT